MKMDAVELRTGAVCDWVGLHAHLVLCFASMERRIDPPSSLAGMTPDSLAAMSEDTTIVTLWQGGMLVASGFLSDTGRAVYLSKLAVHPDCRRTGLLRRIVAEAEALARHLGRPTLELCTRVELVENHAVFKRLGFVEVARTAHPGFDRPTSVTMERPVDQP
jgi:GNAT superfamily N-acetyltransferase